MKDIIKKSPQTSSKKRFLIFGIATLVIILLGFGGWKLYESTQSESYPLGNKLEYIGKKDYKSPWIEPYSVYYYATDLKPEDFKKYFTKATAEQENEVSFIDGYATLKFKKDKEIFSLEYYEDNSKILQTINMSSSQLSAKHIVSLSDSEYTTAKNSL